MVSDTGMDWAKANGVSDGINPTVNITHEQLVTMLYRYVGSPATNGSLDNFSDASTVRQSSGAEVSRAAQE